MNEKLVLIAIGVVVAAFILRPLLRGRAGHNPAKPTSTVPVTAVSEELSELELDRSMGRISDEDFDRWRRELEEAPPEVPASTPPPEVPATTPAPVDAAARAEALVRQWRDAPRPACPDCGLRPEPAARFCSNCGASLTS